jgi:adenosylcobinamide-phosphate synthase
MRAAARALTLVGAAALDAALGEPAGRWHPVAAVGGLLGLAHEPLRRRSPRAQLVGGGVALGGVALGAGVGALAVQRALGRGLAGVAGGAVALKPAFALRQLLEEATGVAGALEDGRLEEARARLRALVSRPTDALDAPLVAAAAIESLAENLCDSVLAPWLAFALLGLPGAAAYRVVNTADAMYGYRGELDWMGKAAARTDDVCNWLPARATALALVGAAALTEGSARSALHCWRTDARRTESWNAGRPMAAMAGALRRRLEKPGQYVLGGEYPAPRAEDVRRAVRLARVAAALALGASATLSYAETRFSARNRAQTSPRRAFRRIRGGVG